MSYEDGAQFEFEEWFLRILLSCSSPQGTIVLDNPAAQPADVLLMSATPHRRARSAAWSYHFYPEEKSVDLKILLPCAILLKEVHLQPHHMSLASTLFFRPADSMHSLFSRSISSVHSEPESSLAGNFAWWRRIHTDPGSGSHEWSCILTHDPVPAGSGHKCAHSLLQTERS